MCGVWPLGFCGSSLPYYFRACSAEFCQIFHLGAGFLRDGFLRQHEALHGGPRLRAFPGLSSLTWIQPDSHCEEDRVVLDALACQAGLARWLKLGAPKTTRTQRAQYGISYIIDGIHYGI